MSTPPPNPKSPQVSPVARENNFDLVRLAFAATVVLYHCCAVSQNNALRVFTGAEYLISPVEGFFAISGFLIFASYERSKSVRDYIAKRAWRILPGYWLATCLCLLIAFSFGCFHVGEFLLANLSFLNFLHPGVSGVFTSNFVPAMDGALWTIKVEVSFYVLVPMIVWLCRCLNRDIVLWGLFVASIVFRVVFAKHERLVTQIPGQLSYFVMGGLIYYHLPLFTKYGKWILSAAMLCYLVHYRLRWQFLGPLSIPPLTLGIALLLPVVKGPTRWGDFSYGTYVLHYPIIQLLVSFGIFSAHPWLGVLLTVAIVANLAVFSWFVVEKPSLDHAHARAKRLKSSYASL